jgi:hypothetical protein
MLYFWGYPSELAYADDGVRGPESDCVAEVGYGPNDDRLQGTLRYSKTTALRAALVLDTEAGIVLLDDTDEASIRLRPTGAPDLEHVIHARGNHSAPQQDVFRLQLEDFVVACTQRTAPRVDGLQGAASVRLVNELYARRRPLRRDWYPRPLAEGPS